MGRTESEVVTLIRSRPKKHLAQTERGSKYRGVSKNGKKWQVSVSIKIISLSKFVKSHEVDSQPCSIKTILWIKSNKIELFNLIGIICKYRSKSFSIWRKSTRVKYKRRGLRPVYMTSEPSTHTVWKPRPTLATRRDNWFASWPAERTSPRKTLSKVSSTRL